MQRVDHFAGVFANQKVEVRDCGEKGVGVFAKQSFKKGDVIFSEKPIASSQLLRVPRGCDFCHRYLKDLDFQWEVLLNPEARASDPRAQLPGLSEREKFLSKIVVGSQALYECKSQEKKNCASFCSQECLDRHVKLLEKVSEVDQLRAYAAHAAATENPFFLLALVVLLKEDATVAHLLKRPYWECVDLPADPAERTAHQEILKKESREAFDLLVAIPFFKDLKEEEFYNLLGSLCMNAIVIKFHNPLVFYHQEVHGGEHGEEARAALHKMLPDLIEDESDSDSDSDADEEMVYDWGDLEVSTKLFKPMKAYALYAMLSAVNHSCAYTAEAVYANDHTLLLVASEDIQAGEEIFISYIDAGNDTADRQEELAPYGFQCACSKCNRPLKKRKAK